MVSLDGIDGNIDLTILVTSMLLYVSYIYIYMVKKYAVLSRYNLLFFFKVSYCIFKVFII